MKLEIGEKQLNQIALEINLCFFILKKTCLERKKPLLNLIYICHHNLKLRQAFQWTGLIRMPLHHYIL